MRAAGSVESDLPDLRDDSSNSSFNGELENDNDVSNYIGSENSDEDYGDDDGSFLDDEKEFSNQQTPRYHDSYAAIPTSYCD